MTGKQTRGRSRIQLLNNLVSKDYRSLKKGAEERLMCGMQETEERHQKPALWQVTAETCCLFCLMHFASHIKKCKEWSSNTDEHSRRTS